MPRRLAEQTNTARTHLTLNEVVICYASYRFALIIFKRFACCLQNLKKHGFFIKRWMALIGFSLIPYDIIRIMI